MVSEWIMPADVQFDRDKLKAVVLHVCGSVPIDRLGPVRLHRTLYLLDMLHYALTGRAATGATYTKRPSGPSCVPLVLLLAELEREGTLELRESDWFGFRRVDYVTLKTPEAGRLHPDEIALLDQVIDHVCLGGSPKVIAELNERLPWELASYGDVIGYETALSLFSSEPSAAAINLVQAEAGTFETARSRGDAVARSTYEDFRSRVRAAGR